MTFERDERPNFQSGTAEEYVCWEHMYVYREALCDRDPVGVRGKAEPKDFWFKTPIPTEARPSHFQHLTICFVEQDMPICLGKAMPQWVEVPSTINTTYIYKNVHQL